MPYNANAACRHHKKRRVTNWSEYYTSQRQRGSPTVWFSEQAVDGWGEAPRTTPSGQPNHSNLAMAMALTLRAIFRQALRQTEGLIGSILHLLGVDILELEPITQ